MGPGGTHGDSREWGFAGKNLFTDMNDWRAKGRQEYALGAIAMGQWGPAEHMGTMGEWGFDPT